VKVHDLAAAEISVRNAQTFLQVLLLEEFPTAVQRSYPCRSSAPTSAAARMSSQQQRIDTPTGDRSATDAISKQAFSHKKLSTQQQQQHEQSWHDSLILVVLAARTAKTAVSAPLQPEPMVLNHVE